MSRKHTYRTGGGPPPKLNECEKLLFDAEENTVKIQGIPGITETGGKLRL